MKVAINGFGRIGRTVFRTLLENADIEIAAINDLAEPATLAHLVRYDSVHRGFKGTVEAGENALIVNGRSIPAFSEASPENLPWADLQIDVVIESTGRFLSRAAAEAHLRAGARQVIISAPPSTKDVQVVVLGVNDHQVDFRSPVLSNASCTTNNIAPMIKVLEENWGIVNGYITTVHSMTGDQNLHDAPHRDLRRARAASSSIIPTTTGAAKAITSIFPRLEGKLGGAGIRVPVLNGSLTDFTCTLVNQPTVEEINEVFRKAAANELQGILQYTSDPIVSVDILDNPHSCIFDSLLTSVVGGITKVVGWYDNEYGYSSRLTDMVKRIALANAK
ncbi:glyceraldehyde 3-phosphate dehydrogenase [Arcticibacter pallidicorallinus]|uniref:Glyceraldehyde-3-phosphate dehydrogenase n=1 Tax=Arcticibacter pallidicorallinus TaxID=1259464 RepID=A0A2T0UBP9_9SPHI|nr:type I glyceraldehyde-3-phosphate dehydrogenase [Arcticibacter pallidicorallinus]PRY55365.1 glyceraldehyde 3-phosphate dehydrogenase [Arcticibacter pallidicorallinus]